jgi:DNA-binding GntR family transcriptional regulator
VVADVSDEPKRRRRRETLDGKRPQIPTLVEYAAEQLRESILSHELPAGEHIRLDSIAQGLGISPIPLREALRILATEGLVVPLRHRGYTVAAATVADLEETYRLRLVLEPLAVTLAVPLLTDADVLRLRGELVLLEAAFAENDWAEYRVHHRALHFGIYERCNSPWLIRFADMLWLNAQRYQRLTIEIAGEFHQRTDEHQQILDACRAREAEAAASLMQIHLGRALGSLRKFLAANGNVMARASATDAEELDDLDAIA